MRLFLGVFPPAAVQRDVRATLDDLPGAPALRWTAPERLHFTLHFLGEVGEAELPRLRDALAEVVLEPAWIEVEMGGLGAFPHLRRPRVLFVPLRQGGVELESWHARTLHALPRALRPEREGRFRPHLTVSRPRGPLEATDLEALERGLRPCSWRFRATGVDLVRSHLGAGRAHYQSLLRVGAR